MPALISSIGTAVPKYSTNQVDIANFMVDRLSLDDDAARELKILYRASGIKTRYSVLPDFQQKGGLLFFNDGKDNIEPTVASRMNLFKKEALALGMSAVKNAIDQTNLTPSDFTHLIAVSCTGLYAPGLDIELIEEIGFNTNIERTAINFMGCYAAFNALKAAKYIVNAEPEAKVMVVCVELCTIHYQDKTDADSLLANALFSDGAAAAIITSGGHGPIELELSQHYADLSLVGKKEMSWNIGDTGFDMKLSGNVPEVIQQGIKELTSSLLHKLPVSLSDIEFFAIHPGGKRIIEVIEKELNISPESNRPAREVLKSFGNMSSPTILFVINHILHSLSSKDDDKKILCFAFGPGLTMESMLLKIKNSHV
jgi:alpha-pyrone synthase